MDPKKASMWRTFLAMVVTQIALLGALGMCLGKGDIADKVLVTTSWSLVLSLAAVAGHNSIQHLANAGGLKGAVSVLMESATPEPKPPEEETNG